MYIKIYFNTYELKHVYFSLTRFYMACLEIWAVAVNMLFFMLNMYKNKKKNMAIILGCSWIQHFFYGHPTKFLKKIIRDLIPMENVKRILYQPQN